MCFQVELAPGEHTNQPANTVLTAQQLCAPSACAEQSGAEPAVSAGGWQEPCAGAAPAAALPCPGSLRSRPAGAHSPLPCVGGSNTSQLFSVRRNRCAEGF